MNQQNSNEVNDFLLDYGVAHPSPILIQAIAEGSNRASDWLWYAEQVETDAERCYCFARVLYISPKDNVALDALKSLNENSELSRDTVRFQTVFARLSQALAHLPIFSTAALISLIIR